MGRSFVMFNLRNAYVYRKNLGKRYKNFTNIIWKNRGVRVGENDRIFILDNNNASFDKLGKLN